MSLYWLERSSTCCNIGSDMLSYRRAAAAYHASSQAKLPMVQLPNGATMTKDALLSILTSEVAETVRGPNADLKGLLIISRATAIVSGAD